MSKSDAEVFNKIKQLVDSGGSIQIDRKFGGYEITVWPNSAVDDKYHKHYNGSDLTETIMRINE